METNDISAIRIGDYVKVKNISKYSKYNFDGMIGEVANFYHLDGNAISFGILFPNMKNPGSKMGTFYFELQDITAHFCRNDFPKAQANLDIDKNKNDMCGKIFFDVSLKNYNSKNGIHRTIIAEITKVKYHPPATIVFWSDGTKTVVKAENEEFDPEKGLAMAISKKVMGNGYGYYDTFRKFLPKEKESRKTKKPIAKVLRVEEDDAGVKIYAQVNNDSISNGSETSCPGFYMNNNTTCCHCSQNILCRELGNDPDIKLTNT